MNSIWTPTLITAVDNAYDRRNASDGHSRFGAYLRQHGVSSLDCDETLTAEEFACVVWPVATAPVMSPGYVRLRPDIDQVTTWWSEDDSCTLHFDVHLPLPRTALTATRALPYGWKDWQPARRDLDDGPYRTWWQPGHTGNALLTTTVVRLAVTDEWALPAPSGRDSRLVTDAKASVAAVADAINRLAGPMVAALRGEGR